MSVVLTQVVNNKIKNEPISTLGACKQVNDRSKYSGLSHIPH